jgi:sulfonate transport system permease protein
MPQGSVISLTAQKISRSLPSNAVSSDPYDERLAHSEDWPPPRRGLLAQSYASLKDERARYGLLGLAIFFVIWYVATAVVPLPRFNLIPNPLYLFQQWVSWRPEYGVSLFTSQYYVDIAISTARVYAAFAIAVVLGAPLGILLGWNRLARNLLFPIVEMLRPIPPLAWVPLAVLLLYGNELPVVFVTSLAAFFVTVLNTYLGVRSIGESYFRAASCLGYDRWQVLIRVVIPGALPFIFTGLEIAMGVAWFALVGGELIAGRSGLGYLIFDGYTEVALPNIFIGMITLGVLGYVSSAGIRALGAWLMAWRNRGREN